MKHLEESAFTNEPKQPERVEGEKTPLEGLWKEYGFLGHPPKPGSGADSRLRELCKTYMTYVLTPRFIEDGSGSEDAENYFSPRNRGSYQLSDQKVPSSVRRRELHNQIALMAMGKQRSGMDENLALRIADFACIITHGMTVPEAEAVRTGPQI